MYRRLLMYWIIYVPKASYVPKSPYVPKAPYVPDSPYVPKAPLCTEEFSYTPKNVYVLCIYLYTEDLLCTEELLHIFNFIHQKLQVQIIMYCKLCTANSMYCSIDINLKIKYSTGFACNTIFQKLLLYSHSVPNIVSK